MHPTKDQQQDEKGGLSKRADAILAALFIAALFALLGVVRDWSPDQLLSFSLGVGAFCVAMVFSFKLYAVGRTALVTRNLSEGLSQQFPGRLAATAWFLLAACVPIIATTIAPWLVDAEFVFYAFAPVVFTAAVDIVASLWRALRRRQKGV